MIKRPFDLKRHVSAPVSKWHLLKLVLYITVLTILGVVYWRQVSKLDPPKTEKINQIEGVTISTE